MKKILLVFAFLMVFAVPLDCRASEDDLVYSVINGRTIITGYRGQPEFIEIPQIIENYPVTEIRTGAFYGCRSLKMLILPSTLEKIGENSFYACYSLEEVIIPDNVKKLGNGCFCGCTSLTSVTVPVGISEIPESCFRACVNLVEVNIPENVSRIGSYAFSGCTGLSRVTLGEELNEIGERAFFMCESLEKLYVPSSLTLLEKESVGYAPSNQGAAPAAGFELSCRHGSAAEEYAGSNGVKYVITDDIIRTASSFHPSEKSERMSELCVIAVIFAFTAAAAKSSSARKH